MAERTTKRWMVLVWETLSKYKRAKAHGKCMRCGKQKEMRYLHAHHLVPKSRGNFARFCEDNIVVMCWYCHKMWWHGDSTWDEQRDLIEKWIGLERYDEINRLSVKGTKYSADDYEEMLTYYKHRLEEATDSSALEEELLGDPDEIQDRTIV